MNENFLKAAIAFVAGILVVLISFYIGKQVLGPILTGPASPVATRLPAEKVVSVTSRPIPNAIARRDIDQVPAQTIAAVEPLSRPQPLNQPNESDLPQPPEASEGPEPTTQPPTRELKPPRPPSVTVPAPSPPVATYHPPSPQPKAQTRPAPSQEGTPQERTSPPERAPSPPPPPVARQKRFRVRIGVFENPENVDRVQERLRQSGYESFVTEESMPTGSRYKVYVGAFADREQAQALQKELSEKGIDSVIDEVPEE